MMPRSLLILAATCTITHANPGRSSADYTLFHETTTGASGGRSTSADYTLDTSGDTAGSESTSTDYRHRDGFAGQLVDPAGIEISTSPHHVINEGGSRQLVADILNDDDTVGAPITPTWSIVSGPLASIDSGGLVTTDIVYENTPAVAGASYLGLSGTFDLFVVDIDTDNYGSYAGDGLADWWQVGHFGIDNPDAAPGVDVDGDSHDNDAEYLSLTDPHDADSHLTSILTSPDTIELSKVIFLSTYTLMRSTDLISWVPTGLVVNPPVGPPMFDFSFTDPNPPTGVRVFYKIDIDG